jgi:predicted transposase YbfD/YdcC
MDIKINLDCLKDLENSNLKIDAIIFQKMLLLYNSIEQGWSVKKQNESYVFSKKHEGKKEVLEDTYLLKFMKTNLDFNKIVS